jgi:peptidoglycan/LPS O-acetylase OafA/YrhL
MGDSSYSIYLTHWTVGSLVVSKTLRWPQTALVHGIWIAVMFCAMIGCGCLCFVLVERPLLELGRRWFTARPDSKSAAPAEMSARAA